MTCFILSKNGHLITIFVIKCVSILYLFQKLFVIYSYHTRLVFSSKHKHNIIINTVLYKKDTLMNLFSHLVQPKFLSLNLFLQIL